MKKPDPEMLALMLENNALRRSISKLFKIIDELETSETSFTIDEAIDEPHLRTQWHFVRLQLEQFTQQS